MALTIYLVDTNRRLHYFFLFFITWELLFLIEVWLIYSVVFLLYGKVAQLYTHTHTHIYILF